MNQYRKRYELKNAAKDKLEGKYGSAVTICIVSFLITNMISLFVDLFLPGTSLTSEPAVSSYIIQGIASLFLSWVLGVMNMGLTLFFLNAACGQPYRTDDLLYGFRKDFSRALAISGAFTLLRAICLYPCQYLYEAYLRTGSSRLLIAALTALAVGACVYLPLSLSISMSYYLALDFPDKTAGEILKLSVKVMHGHKLRFFLLQCSFLPLMALCICSLFIGFLWLNPYMHMTYTCFFLDLMNPGKKA